MPTLTERLQSIEADVLSAFDELKEIIEISDQPTLSAAVKLRLLNSAIISAVSTVEEGFRECLSAYVSHIQEKVQLYAALPGAIKDSNLTCAINSLKKEKGSASIKSTVERLGSCFSGSGEYYLFIDEITNNEGGLKSRQITELCKRVGLEEIWKNIANSSEIYELTLLDDIEDRKQTIISRWNDILEERDTIIHRYSSSNSWAKEKILTEMEYMLLIVKRFVSCLNAAAQAYT